MWALIILIRASVWLQNRSLVNVIQCSFSFLGWKTHLTIPTLTMSVFPPAWTSSVPATDNELETLQLLGCLLLGKKVDDQSLNRYWSIDHRADMLIHRWRLSINLHHKTSNIKHKLSPTNHEAPLNRQTITTSGRSIVETFEANQQLFDGDLLKWFSHYSYPLMQPNMFCLNVIVLRLSYGKKITLPALCSLKNWRFFPYLDDSKMLITKTLTIP